MNNKLHTLLDLKSNIPSFIEITDRKVYDVNILDELILEPASFYIKDCAYVDFLRLYSWSNVLHFLSFEQKLISNFEDFIHIRLINLPYWNAIKQLFLQE